MIGTLLTIAILGYYVNSCISGVNRHGRCRI